MAKILVVEDSERLVELLTQRLERRGYVVLVAGDAAAAVASAKASQPDVILLEYELRNDEDWSTARSLKFDELTRDIPIIGLSPNFSEEARTFAIQNGCRDLAGKPIDFGRLMQQIEAAVPPVSPEGVPA